MRKAIVHVSNEKKFTTTAENLSARNIYVQSVRLNGKSWAHPLLPFRELKNGSRLEFVMGPEPNPKWGKKELRVGIDRWTR